MDYQIQVPAFEGPFDLLLHLIRENQIYIYDIPIALITEQYLDYLQRMEELDLDVASSFLVMAATLLAIKARMLLPKPPATDDDEAVDEREELVHDILEYLRFKEAAQQMDRLHAASSQLIARPNEQELYLNLFSQENPLQGKTLDDLRSAFAKVLAKAEESGIAMDVRRQRVTVIDQMDRLFELLSDRANGVAFSAAFDSCVGKIELVVTFLALLELIRQRVVIVDQGRQYGEIYLYPGEINNYDRNVIA